MVGRIVYSKAGRDSGKFMVVIASSEGSVLVCDGKERPLERPKLKNLKHISLTSGYLKEESFSTNRAIRKALKQYEAQSIKEEK